MLFTALAPISCSQNSKKSGLRYECVFTVGTLQNLQYYGAERDAQLLQYLLLLVQRRGSAHGEEVVVFDLQGDVIRLTRDTRMKSRQTKSSTYLRDKVTHNKPYEERFGTRAERGKFQRLLACKGCAHVRD